MKLIKVEWLGNKEAIITVRFPERRKFWFWRHPARTIAFRGSSTIWHYAETGRRAPGWVERRLSEMWTYSQWVRDDMRAARRFPVVVK